MRKPFTALSVVVLALAAAAHLLRLAYGWDATINGTAVPMWVSVLGVLIPGALAVGLWRESRK
ncbi:MAG TPA: hypothetical protein VNK67_15475 [Burkholderiales bacterium]|nr:hypothetical protein [Burkholderiales bacterium]